MVFNSRRAMWLCWWKTLETVFVILSFLQLSVKRASSCVSAFAIYANESFCVVQQVSSAFCGGHIIKVKSRQCWCQYWAVWRHSFAVSWGLQHCLYAPRSGNLWIAISLFSQWSRHVASLEKPFVPDGVICCSKVTKDCPCLFLELKTIFSIDHQGCDLVTSVSASEKTGLICFQ